MKKNNDKRSHGKSVRNLLKKIILLSVFIVVFNYLFSSFRIFNDSMEPELKRGDYIVSVKLLRYKPGDIIAFKYHDRVMIKRIIAANGATVKIDRLGNVFVDNRFLSEKYVVSKSFNKCNTGFPYRVPAGSFFVMGDKRDSSVDSRMEEVGSVPEKSIIGKVILKVYPLNEAGTVK